MKTSPRGPEYDYVEVPENTDELPIREVRSVQQQRMHIMLAVFFTVSLSAGLFLVVDGMPKYDPSNSPSPSPTPFPSPMSNYSFSPSPSPSPLSGEYFAANPLVVLGKAFATGAVMALLMGALSLYATSRLGSKLSRREIDYITVEKSGGAKLLKQDISAAESTKGTLVYVKDAETVGRFADVLYYVNAGLYKLGLHDHISTGITDPHLLQLAVLGQPKAKSVLVALAHYGAQQRAAFSAMGTAFAVEIVGVVAFKFSGVDHPVLWAGLLACIAGLIAAGLYAEFKPDLPGKEDHAALRASSLLTGRSKRQYQLVSALEIDGDASSAAVPKQK